MDASGWLGASTWVVEASINSVGSDSRGIGTLQITIEDQLWNRPSYYWLGKYETPLLLPETELTVEFAEPSRKVEVDSRHKILVLQAAGTPDELGAGARDDGASPFATLLIFDESYQLLDAGGGYYEAYSEILSLYPGRNLENLIQLLDDAWVLHEFDNEWALAVRSSPDPANAPDRSEGRPATPGPLGEWRVDHKFETPLDEDESALAAWMETPSNLRQLPVSEDELMPGLEAALNVDRLELGTAFVEVSDAFSMRYAWIGFRIVDSGVIGPFSTDAQGGLVPISGYGPVIGVLEFVGWSEVDVVDLGALDVLATLRVEDWTPPSVLWIQADLDGEAGVRIDTVSLDEQGAAIRAGSSGSDTPESETETGN